MYRNGEESRYQSTRQGVSKKVIRYTVPQHGKSTGSIVMSYGRRPSRTFQSHSIERDLQFINEEKPGAIGRRQERPYHIRNHLTRSYRRFQHRKSGSYIVAGEVKVFRHIRSRFRRDTSSFRLKTRK
jgi:hypothetical protein